MGLRDVVAKRRAERERPKTLAELRAAKKQTNNKPKPKSLAELRKAKLKQAARSSKLDFHRGGIRYHNVRQMNGYWYIDVSNGDKTYALHNRCGAWMHDVEGREGWMKEPAWVARALGTDVSQLEIGQALIHRLELELRERGILTPEQQRRKNEEEAKAKKRAKRQPKQD